jgi:hypothetical protein
MAEYDANEAAATGGPPDWLSMALDVNPMDVRPLLLEGADPFTAVMEAAAGVEFGGFLVIDAPFNPSPLRRVLAARGFSSYGRKLKESHWRVFFHQDGGDDWERGAEVEVSPEGALTWREEDGIHIDVRKLAPPNPLLAIMRLIDSLDEPVTVVVHHEREPHFLAPELAERGWHIVKMANEFVNVRLWLERVS